MQPEREILNHPGFSQLASTNITVSWGSDTRNYTLIRPIGRGQTAVAWLARDSVGTEFAVKLVPKGEYASHSLDAETQRANSLAGDLFAKIVFFGDTSIDASDIDTSLLYAVIVEWVDGVSLEQYIGSPHVAVDVEVFCRLARDLCSVLQALRTASPKLTHGDLHERNILVRSSEDVLTGVTSDRIAVIDTGQLKTLERRDKLLEVWRQQLEVLNTVRTSDNEALSESITRQRELIDWFHRTDQEWVVCHLCSLFNKMLSQFATFNSVEKRFCFHLPDLLRQMIDHDHSRRLDDPRQMYREIERLRQESRDPGPTMTTPFDLPSAELIRSDRQLMDLFSDEYPRLEACRSYAPVYIYGPRGSGKSTILRSLSLRAILASEHPGQELDKIPFVGVYLSSSQELRSRFWLMTEEDFQALDGHVIQYFNLLLLDSLVGTLDCLYGYTQSDDRDPGVPQLTSTLARELASAVRQRLTLDSEHAHYSGTSEFALLRHDIQKERDTLWSKILDKSEPKLRPNAQLVFDVVRDLENCWDFLSDRRIVFLIDDYSNQRIPRELQKRLNQAITFSKQGSPVFKVTSEYNGVDLEGVQEGREVSEVNVGYEYVRLTGRGRYSFLLSMLTKRFSYCQSSADLLTVLPMSGLSPGIPMAKEIRESHGSGHRFSYHGLDTIGDLCSGDFAMGIDVVRRIFEHAGENWRNPNAIPPSKQDEAIREYATQEFEYLRHQSRNGRKKYEIADSLCWLAGQCVLRQTTMKEGEQIPLIKTHLDIGEKALRDLEASYHTESLLLHELVTTGVLFPLQTSRALQDTDATRRFMTRRILLTRYKSPLARHTPVRINDVQQLLWFLTEPRAFMEKEVAGWKGGEKASSTTDAPTRKKQRTFFEDENAKD